MNFCGVPPDHFANRDTSDSDAPSEDNYSDEDEN